MVAKKWKIRYNETDGVADVLFIKANVVLVIEDKEQRLIEADGVLIELQHKIVGLECLDTWGDDNRFFDDGLYTKTVLPEQCNYSKMSHYLEDFGKAVDREARIHG